MFTLSLSKQVHLSTPRSECSGVLAARPKKYEFGDIAEIEADTPTVAASVLPHFVPDDIRLVVEAPRFHDSKTIGQKRVRNP